MRAALQCLLQRCTQVLAASLVMNRLFLSSIVEKVTEQASENAQKIQVLSKSKSKVQSGIFKASIALEKGTCETQFPDSFSKQSS